VGLTAADFELDLNHSVGTIGTIRYYISNRDRGPYQLEILNISLLMMAAIRDS